MQVYEVTYIGDDGMDKTRLMACERIENLFGYINSKVWCETVKIIKKIKVEIIKKEVK